MIMIMTIIIGPDRRVAVQEPVQVRVLEEVVVLLDYIICDCIILHYMTLFYIIL